MGVRSQVTANSPGAAPRPDQITVLAGLIAIIGAAWVYLLLGAGIEMDKLDMGGGDIMPMMPEWTSGHAALVFLMWAVMMAAMMLPSAAPAIVQLVSLSERSVERPYRIPATLFFVTGYLMVWTGFSFAATFLQWILDSRNLLSETMAIRDGVIAALLVLAVGLFQLTPWKRTCLRRCRSPMRSLSENQLRSVGAIWRLGLRDGVSCLGCCWALMCLLFVGGLMNSFWMVAIAFWVFAEKILPWGDRVSFLGAAGLVAWGGASLAIALV
jgi:predicted metal-binding membrane protein